MTKKIFFWIKNNLQATLLLGIVLAVCLTNYKSGTLLSGWDNLHPEFDFSVNLKRALFASWQEYQGLGLLGGMGHAADLFRQIILWIFSFVLPLNFLRYFFHFSMLLTGALGINFLLKNFVLEKYSETTNKWGSIAGAIFYLFNLGTLQMFYVPFEVFSTHFGFLPWLFLGVFKYLKEPSKKNLLIFILINILSVSQGYVATVFLVYLMVLCLILIQIVIPDLIRNLHKLFYRFQISFGFAQDSGMTKGLNSSGYSGRTKRVLIVLFVTFCVNAFWLLPNLYFVLNDVKTNTEAKISQMATENNLLLNKKYGDFENVVLLKGFWFDNVEIQSDGKTDFIMGDWVKRLQNPYIQGIGYSLFGLSTFGVLLGLITKNKYGLLFLPVFLLGFTFLANDTWGFSFLTKLFYKLPLVSQIFRFPFTKFAILTTFCEAIFFGISVGFIISERKGFLPPIRRVGMTVIIVLPIVFMFPVFQGKLFYNKEKAKIPSEYFQVFDFFKTQDKNTRIAEFPIPNFWGWTLYDWGKNGMYSGSGFLWYGIEQPILSRNFDMWSRQNENYYWEISYALYSKNQELFENVLEKYQVNWLLVDSNIINPGAEKALFLGELEEMLMANSTQQIANSYQLSAISYKPKYELAQTFGKIKIYKVNLETLVKDFVWVGENLPVVNGYKWGNYDRAYGEVGNYISQNDQLSMINYQLNSKFQIPNSKQSQNSKFKIQNTAYDAYYPFRSLFTGRKTDELEVGIEDLGDRFVFKAKLPEGIKDYVIELPQSYDGKELVEIDPITYETKYFIPSIDVVGDKKLEVGSWKLDNEIGSGKLEAGSWITVSFPKIRGLLSAEIDSAKQNLPAKNCNQFSSGEVRSWKWDAGNEVGSGKIDTLRIEAQDANNCGAGFWLPNLSHQYAYLISAETKNISGKPLLFWVENLTNRKADQEIYLTKNYQLPIINDQTNSNFPSSAKASAGRQNSKERGLKSAKTNNQLNAIRYTLYANYMIQPPMASDGLGYSLHFDNISIGREKTVNELGKINVNLIPYQFLTELKMVNSQEGWNKNTGGVYLTHSGSVQRVQQMSHPNPAVYEVTLNSKGSLDSARDDKILVLSQAYHEGWKAYEIFNFQFSIFKQLSNFKFLKQNLPFLFGKELEHIKINNWSNGWNLPPNSYNLIPNSYIIVFWPQWLEYIGFGTLIILIILINLIDLNNF